MTERITIPSDASAEQINMIVGTLYLSVGYAISHIARSETMESSDKFKNDFIASLQGGGIDMAIFDDAKTFDSVVSMIQGLLTTELQPQSS
jgi:hypothetical protein